MLKDSSLIGLVILSFMELVGSEAMVDVACM